MNAEQLRRELIAVLEAAGGPLTTTAVRAAVSTRLNHRGRAVVAEEVYRALLVLQRRGIVRRVFDQPGHLAHWELAVLFADTTSPAGEDAVHFGDSTNR